MNFLPLSNYVLVKPIEQSNTLKSGLVIPESSLDKPNQGEVIKVGEGLLNDDGETLPISVVQGDKILFSKYAGIEIKLDGEKYLLIRDTELLGKFTE